MKILFVCENYYPHLGGAEVLFKNLAERLCKNHEVSILTHHLKDTNKKENLNGVDIHRVSSFFSRYVFTFSSLPKAIRLARKHDLVQTTTFNAAFPAWVAAKIAGKPVVLTVHEVWAGKWKQVTGFSWFKSGIHDLLERMIYFLPFDKYVCVSDATRRDLLKLGINKNKVERVYNGLDYAFWNSSNFKEEEIEKIRKDLDLQDKFVYFSWGRSGSSKGFEYAIKAAKFIAEKIPNSVFLLMLGTPQKYKKKHQELLNLVSTSSAREHIKIIDSQSYAQLGCYLKAVDCVVVPSVSEGFGYTTVEAATMGVPVVVSDAGSLPEIVSGKYQIFKSKNILDLAEKVVKVANQEYQQKKVKKFEWKNSADKYLKIYSSLLIPKADLL